MARPEPWLTPEEIQLQLQTRVPRSILAWDAIIEILAAHLPPLIEARGNLPQPGCYAYAGTDISRYRMPWILVSSSMNTQEVGVQWHDTHNLLITCAYRPTVTSEQLRVAAEIIGLCRAILSVPRIMANYRGPDGNGALLWVRLIPQGISFTPADWPEYQGIVGHWLLQQPPDAKSW